MTAELLLAVTQAGDASAEGGGMALLLLVVGSGGKVNEAQLRKRIE